MTTNRNTAGGRATESGMGFQAAVASRFAAYQVADMPVGNAFGLLQAKNIISLQCETGDAVDDVVAQLDGGGTIYVQAKTRPTLSDDSASPLGKTIAQLVALDVQLGASLDPERHAVVLAVRPDAARSLDALEDACRQFDKGGTWPSVVAKLPGAGNDALKKFETLVVAAWSAGSPLPPSGDDLVRLARVFRIVRFPEDGGSGWAELAHLLGRRLYGGDHAGDAPMAALLAICRDLIRTGAPADRNGLLRALRAEGHIDVSAPTFDKDIATLKAYSNQERQRLNKHTRLPLGGGIPITRDCLKPLAQAVAHGSLLVTGEPGAGKTGLLVALANQLSLENGPVLFFSVERFSGFQQQSDFRAELSLEHDPIEVMAAWPGDSPGVLIVDALDASRGGRSEPVIAAFIAAAVARLGERWSVVASIRSFDLRNGRRFREIMPGAPPNSTYAEVGLDKVRHFHVPRLSPGELAAVAMASDGLRDLETTAPTALKTLLRNIFNLSLAAELLAEGVEAREIRTVTRQADLITRYEDVRLPTIRLQRAVKDTVGVMVTQGRLTVRATDVANDAVDEVLQAGVLVPAGRQIAFAHHVLFDHAAGRFYLAGNDTTVLQQQLVGGEGIGLMLGPALRFALEEVWQTDSAGRPITWDFLAELSAASQPEPVMLSIALRTAAESVSVPEDVGRLKTLIENSNDPRATAKLVGQLARFLGLAIAEQGGLSNSAALAWGEVAGVIAKNGASSSFMADAGRVLLMTLSDRGDFGDADFVACFGAAARSFLRAAWATNPPHDFAVSAGIRFVTKSFGSDAQASRALLERILEPANLDARASKDAPWLAEGVTSIIPHDPGFVARIYGALFNYEVTDDDKTWVGGAASRILPLTSTKRQDYQHARWQLNQALRPFLDADPVGGTQAVIEAVKGLAEDKGHDRSESRTLAVPIGGREIRVVDDLLSLQDWREEDVNDEEPLQVFVNFLRQASPEAFRSALNVAMEVEANAAVWARLLGVAADRPGVADDLLWTLASYPQFAALQGVARDAVIYLTSAYAQRATDERSAFERAALAPDLFPEGRETKWWRSLLARLLSGVTRDDLTTPEMQALFDELSAVDDLKGNPPFVRITSGWGSSEDIVDSMLRDDGVNLEKSPDREVRAASRKVEDQLEIGKGERDAAGLTTLWADVTALVAEIDAAGEELHPNLAHSSWGAVSNGVERLSKSKAYTPEVEGMPDLDTLLQLIDRLSQSPYPERDDDSSSDSMGWGNWDVRVYAASSLVGLAPRFGEQRPDIVERMAEFLKDRTPTVRLQIAQALNVLWNVARPRMWELVEEVAASETHPGVRRFFIAGPMGPLARAEPARCDAILDGFLERDWATARDDVRKDRVRDAEPTANLAALLYVVFDQPRAGAWIRKWATDLVRGGEYLTAMLHFLRVVYFYPYRSDTPPNQTGTAVRGREVLDLAVNSAAAVLNEARPYVLSTDEAMIAKWQPAFMAADKVIDGVCNQIFYGSGAFRHGSDEHSPGLATPEAKRQFLTDFASVLDTIAAHAQARTVHNLMKVLAYLEDGDPPGVFDRASAVLLGPASQGGYQYESLGVDALVTLVRRYLADHREIFEDTARRQKLVEVLELFSNAGWPDALKLLFELPDLLR
jgi:hypothetical protein